MNTTAEKPMPKVFTPGPRPPKEPQPCPSGCGEMITLMVCLATWRTVPGRVKTGLQALDVETRKASAKVVFQIAEQIRAQRERGGLSREQGAGQ